MDFNVQCNLFSLPSLSPEVYVIIFDSTVPLVNQNMSLFAFIQLFSKSLVIKEHIKRSHYLKEKKNISKKLVLPSQKYCLGLGLGLIMV